MKEKFNERRISPQSNQEPTDRQAEIAFWVLVAVVASPFALAAVQAVVQAVCP